MGSVGLEGGLGVYQRVGAEGDQIEGWHLLQLHGY